MVFKAHHAMVDGIAGAAAAAVLIDFERDVATPTTHHRPSPPPLMSDVVTEGLAHLVSDVAGAVRGAAGMIREPKIVAKEAAVWGDTLSTLAAQAPAMPWNTPLSRRRVYTRRHVALDGIKQVRAATGVTVNDVVLAASTDALGR